MKFSLRTFLLLAHLLLTAACASHKSVLATDSSLPSPAHLSNAQALEAGKKIWKNESGGTLEGLTDFDKGEGCDLGIGHFIWYPENQIGPFDESFPKLLAFLLQNDVQVPIRLQQSARCPWGSRKEFYDNFKSPQMMELRRLLTDTIALQARFMANRMEASLPKMLKTLPPEQQEPVRRQFYRLAQDARGLYALMDYVNFKGEGTFPTERYNGQGWGLLQILENMKGTASGQSALDEFSDSAKAVLERRIKNSPPERNEARWRNIWFKRIETYRTGSN